VRDATATSPDYRDGRDLWHVSFPALGRQTLPPDESQHHEHGRHQIIVAGFEIQAAVLRSSPGDDDASTPSITVRATANDGPSEREWSRCRFRAHASGVHLLHEGATGRSPSRPAPRLGRVEQTLPGHSGYRTSGMVPAPERGTMVDGRELRQRRDIARNQVGQNRPNRFAVATQLPCVSSGTRATPTAAS
jgi:hypothetical protein